jgi:hypothetical protein
MPLNLYNLGRDGRVKRQPASASFGPPVLVAAGWADGTDVIDHCGTFAPAPVDSLNAAPQTG